jgi:hypothetical protein
MSLKSKLGESMVAIQIVGAITLVALLMPNVAWNSGKTGFVAPMPCVAWNSGKIS